jgi:hypothetical protein
VLIVVRGHEPDIVHIEAKVRKCHAIDAAGAGQGCLPETNLERYFHVLLRRGAARDKEQREQQSRAQVPPSRA